ncbi:MAG: hypothetical protein Q7S00_05540, partial [bacterium]|nr:hypothetical protein [bacterium]
MKHYFKLFLAVGLIGTASFLGCSSSSTPAPVEDVEAVAADVSSLATTPSADISGLDVSLGSGGTTSLIAPSPLTLQASTVVVPRGKSKFLGGGLRETGKSSRAGCDGNMHKKEVFRSGKFAALDRCFPEAMESGGLVTIPTDSYAYYSITPPAESEGNRGGDDGGKLCDEIPDAQADKKADCKSGGSGPSGGTILLRLGRFSDGLRVAMCEGATADAAVLVNEGLYGASGSQYTVDVTRIGNWGGATEEKNFSATIDLGTTGSVTDGVVALGDGSATVTANMNGGFGNGTMTFTATNAVNTVTGGFTGGFTDHFNDCAQTFTGKVFSKFDADSGCSKFSFTGSGMCPQSIANMIPTNLAPADLENFLASFGAELGLMVPLTVDTYQNIKLCPNPNFDPDIVDGTQKPMTVLASGTTCPVFTDAGQEPFAIVTTEQTTDFGTERVQAFTIAASSEYDADCTAVDVDSIVPTAGTIAFGAEKWDCQAEGSFTPVATESLTETQIVALEPAFNKCSLLEEELWNGDGMGGYACDDQDMEGVV